MSTQLPLHPAQQEVYFDQITRPDSSYYNVGGYITMKGKLDRACFVEILRNLPSVFDAYQLRFDFENTKPQCTFDQRVSELDITEFDFCDHENPKEEALAWLQHQFNQAFDLDQNHFYEILLIKLGEEEYLWAMRYHHLITDGYGFGVLLHYIANQYSQLVNPALPKTDFNFPSYEEEVKQAALYLESNSYEKDANYWQGLFKQIPDPILTKQINEQEDNTNGDILTLTISPAQRASFERTATATGTSLQQLTLAALSLYFGRTQDRKHMVFGVPIHKRRNKRQRNMMGMFTGIIPFKGTYDAEESITNLIQNVKRQQRTDYRYQSYPISHLNRALNLFQQGRNQLFEVEVIYDTLNIIVSIDGMESVTSYLSSEEKTSPLELRWCDYGPEQPLELKMSYQYAYFSGEEADLLSKRIVYILEQLEAGLEQRADQIDVLLPVERKILLGEQADQNGTWFNPAAQDLKNTLPINLRYEAIVDQYQEELAVVHGEERWSYRKLNDFSNQIAHSLKELGVQPGDFVGIYLDRSPQLVAGLLGIIKSGGVYVPLDTQNPKERIEKMLKSSEAKVILTTEALLEALELTNLQGAILMEEQVTATLKDRISIQSLADLRQLPTTNPENQNKMDSWAYMLYTSGSTGEPKGAITRHNGAMNHILAEYEAMELADGFRFLQSAGIGSDISVWQILAPLLKGGCVVMIDKNDLLDYDLLLNLLEAEKINLVEFVPSFIWGMMDHIKALRKAPLLEHLQWMMLSGEEAPVTLVNDWKTNYPAIRILNAYGPCEASDDIVQYEVKEVLPPTVLRVPIGRPVANMKIFVLNAAQELCPIGVVGELCVAGVGVGAGYKGMPEKTAESFVKNPFAEGEETIMYKTGDLARWLPDGNLEFFGRKDSQVKIRGHRVELGEIEALLRQAPSVKEVHLVTHQADHNQELLVAFVIPTDATSETEPIERNLWEICKGELPVYMRPTHFSFIETMPLNLSDKIDSKKLLQQFFEKGSATLNLNTNAGYVAPRNKVEKDLTEIWTALLNVTTLGIYDNFFELGGDSIVIIQVVSRAKRLGYQLKPSDIFRDQTIAALAKQLKEGAAVIVGEQGQLTGTAGLLPIQQYYFEQEYVADAYANQTILLAIDKSLSPKIINQVLQSIIAQHDALRFYYQKENGAWEQTYGTEKGALLVVDLTQCKGTQLAEEITKESQRYQATPNKNTGELITTVLFQTPTEEEENRLLLAIDHLAIDGVSWRILLDELEEGLTAISKGAQIPSVSKTSSYREWHNFLMNYANKAAVSSQQAYWENVIQQYKPLPLDNKFESPTVTTYATVENYESSLSASLSTALLKEVNQAYQTEIEDILLSALAQTIQTWTGLDQIVLGLEGHGREELSPELDLSNSIGWFTSLYPVALSVTPKQEASDLIKSTKEQLRAIPGKGLGYGLLRYLHPTMEVRDSLSEGKWDIVFNYLGQFASTFENKTWFQQAKEDVGPFVGTTGKFVPKLEINASLTQGVLNIVWTYSKEQYKPETIAALAEKYKEVLAKLINHCQAKEETEPTAFDYGLAPEVSYQELDAFLNTEDPNTKTLRKEAISSLYRLSPIQEGMLFHYIYDRSSSAYKEQLIFDFDSAVDQTALEAAWNQLIQAHSILRSNILYEELNLAVQCVYKEVSVPFEYVDYSGLALDAKEEKVKTFIKASQTQGLDFSKAPVMRVALLKLSDKSYKMIWTYHHIFVDGWSVPIILEKLLRNYEALVGGQSLTMQAEERYEDYIQYLSQRDKFAEEAFWKNYLADFDTPSLLPFVGTTKERNRGEAKVKVSELIFEPKRAAKIKQFVQNNHITTNTLIEGIWALLLSHYTGNKDVVYGVIVSGRPSALTAADEKVGMYINTLALRTKVAPEEAVQTWLTNIQQNHTDARSFEYTGLKAVQNWANISGDFFDSILVFEHYPIGEVLSQDWSLKIKDVEVVEETNYLLTINVRLGETLKINFSYKEDLLSPAYIDLIKNHFETVLEQILNCSPILSLPTKVGTINPLSVEERALILGEKATAAGEWFNQGAKDLGNNLPINVRFENTVAQYPNECAISHNGTKVSYTELNERANQMANCLLELSLERGAFVGVYLERTPDIVACLLAILKVGGVYVPLDTQNPVDRIEKMIATSEMSFVMTSADLALNLSGTKVKGIILTDEATSTLTAKLAAQTIQVLDQQVIQKAATDNLPNQNDLRSWAYMLYTSGSTGEPKGAITRHDGAMNHILAEYEALELADGFRFLQSAGIGSDISLWQMLAPVLKGGTVVIIDKEDLLDYDILLKTLEGEVVTIVEFVPSYIWGIMDHCQAMTTKPTLQKMQWIMMVGEEVPVALVNDWKRTFPHIRVLNGFGPCEASDDIAQYEVTALLEETALRVPIGRPIANMNIFILNEEGELCPIGVSGELCVAGVGVGVGYWKMPEKTAASFVPNPFEGTLGDTMYKTGDLGRWLPDGNLEFLGRIDDQVKIRGHRVELGEIETTIRLADAVKEVHVRIHKNVDNRSLVIAFVVGQEGADQTTIERNLRELCQSSLPMYMQPTHYCFVEAMPLNLSDKIDGKKLITQFNQQEAENAAQGIQKEVVGARNEVEEQLTTIWSTLLNVTNIGIYDNFFELGGDSIVTIQVVSRAKRMGLQLQARDVFEYPTIATLAEKIKDQADLVVAEQGVLTGNASLLPIQQYYFETEYHGSSHYNQSILLELNKEVEEIALAKAIEALITQHDALRFVFSKEGTTWVQTYGTHAEKLIVVDHTEFSNENWSK
ncbi:MAG: amino acid adenylation domain-containing protein, partial [Saprospiraceae bacterium]